MSMKHLTEPSTVKPRFSTRFNFNPRLFAGTVIKGPSVTKPNDVYTIQELLRRYAKGHALPVAMKEAFYSEEYSLPVHGDRDFVDVDIARESLEMDADKLKRRIADEKAAKAKFDAAQRQAEADKGKAQSAEPSKPV